MCMYVLVPVDEGAAEDTAVDAATTQLSYHLSLLGDTESTNRWNMYI